jgi:RecJ-like exonuclease
MRGRKIYGQSKIENCPFCGKSAVAKTEQGVPCCIEHKKAEMPNMKCVCGEYLDVQTGKFGAYFNCMNCGNKNWHKGLEMNDLIHGSIKPSNEEEITPKKEVKTNSEPNIIYTTSDEVDFIGERFR